MLTACLEKLLNHRDLTSSEAAALMEELVAPTTSPVRAGAVLAALRSKGESVSELVGAARMLRRHAVAVRCPHPGAVDVVGTGGDGGRSFNISTAAALVAAGAGAVVAKHGNRAVSGRCGAADVLAELGFNLDVAPEVMTGSLVRHGIGFLFAPRLHPVLGRVAGLRRELGVRSIFNLLGPLCNPAGVRRLVVGVCSEKLVEPFAAVLRELGVERALVVCGCDGLDELSCCAPTRMAELRDGVITARLFSPDGLPGIGVCDPAGLRGGDARCNAGKLRAVLDGSERGTPRAAVLLNAAAAIQVAGLAESIETALPLAARSIDSGRALGRLEALIRESRP